MLNVPLMVQYKQDEQLSVSSYFKLKPEELQLLFERRHMLLPDNQGEKRENLRILEKIGLNDGLIASISSDATTGIIGDVKDIERRRKFYGKNDRSLPHIKSYWFQLWQELSQSLNVMLLVFSCFQLFIAFYSEVKWSWLQAVSVAFAVLFACIISSACDYAKQKQQLRLVAEIKNEKCNVIRGASGTTSEVYVNDLVVGDVVLLEAGDRVPADCILIEEMDMFVDQAEYYPSQADTMRQAEKQSSKNGANHLENPDIVVLQNSIVMSGAGKALVCAVGKGTLSEKEMTKNELLIEEVQTPLQQKLTKFGHQLKKIAYLSAFVIFVCLMIYWIIKLMVEGTPMVSYDSLNLLIENFEVFIAILIVCVPEGLPLAVSIAMAFSTDRLKDEYLLIKNLDALETCGTLNDVITGKTGVLTTADMEVVQFTAGDSEHQAQDPEIN